MFSDCYRKYHNSATIEEPFVKKATLCQKTQHNSGQGWICHIAVVMSTYYPIKCATLIPPQRSIDWSTALKLTEWQMSAALGESWICFILQKTHVHNGHACPSNNGNIRYCLILWARKSVCVWVSDFSTYTTTVVVCCTFCYGWTQCCIFTKRYFSFET